MQQYSQLYLCKCSFFSFYWTFFYDFVTESASRTWSPYCLPENRYVHVLGVYNTNVYTTTINQTTMHTYLKMWTKTEHMQTKMCSCNAGKMYAYIVVNVHMYMYMHIYRWDNTLCMYCWSLWCMEYTLRLFYLRDWCYDFNSYRNMVGQEW